MSLEENIAQKWTAELATVRAMIVRWRSGEMRITDEGQDVTETHILQLESIADALEEGIAVMLQTLNRQ